MKKLNKIINKTITYLTFLFVITLILVSYPNKVKAVEIDCLEWRAEASLFTLNVNEVSRNAYTASVRSAIDPSFTFGNSGAFTCPKDSQQYVYTIGLYKDGALVKSLPLTKGVIRHPSESYCILADTGTRTLTLDEGAGDYKIALTTTEINYNIPLPYLKTDSECSIPVTYTGANLTCNENNVCKKGELAGCSTEGGVCLLNPLDNTYRCYEPEEIPGEPPEWMVNQCKEEVACGPLTRCQKGIFAGCENDSQICISVEGANGGKSVSECVDIDDPAAIEQCGGDSCIDYGSGCSLGGSLPCCKQESTGKAGVCIPETLKCGYVDHDDFDGEFPDLDICPTCTTQYGDPQTLLSLIYRIVTPVGIIIGLFLMVTCGYKIMFSHGDPRAVADARDCFQSAIIGMLFILLSVSILRLVINSIIATV